MDKTFKVTVNESFEYNFKNSDHNKLDVIKLETSNYHVINNNKSFNVSLQKANFNNREYTLSVNGNNYTVKIGTQLDELIKKMGFSIGASKKANVIKAPMPGIILNIGVKVGQQVKEGDTLLILEAMKMENSIRSPKNGIVKAIHLKSGETVEKGVLMIELE